MNSPSAVDPKASTDINGRDNDPMPDIRSRDNK
ncbi:unnamed protein product [Trichobilharzia regenti]|nr:unnamed protein product [Trichobilharzia regenti]